jgi:hypothetical protein
VGRRLGSAKYQSASHGKRLLPNALVAGACASIKLIKPHTAPHHKRFLIDVFHFKLHPLHAGGWLTTAQAATLKDLASAL